MTENPVEAAGGVLNVEKSLGSGGTGGTKPSSWVSPFTANEATRSFKEVASPEWMLDTSLPALFRLAFPVECLPEVADTDVALVVTDMVAESLELGVPV